tara:strand:- start:161 stop:619 length:459 start_codon:yes stop_codon:yes gene_type:complete
MYGSNHTYWEQRRQEQRQDPEFRERERAHKRLHCRHLMASPPKGTDALEGLALPTLTGSFPALFFGVGIDSAGSAPKWLPVAFGAASVFVINPFLIKLVMRKAPYKKRVIVSNAILAAIGVYMGSKAQSERAQSHNRQIAECRTFLEKHNVR